MQGQVAPLLCPFCRGPLPGPAAFCSHCGRPLAWVATQQVPMRIPLPPFACPKCGMPAYARQAKCPRCGRHMRSPFRSPAVMAALGVLIFVGFLAIIGSLESPSPAAAPSAGASFASGPPAKSEPRTLVPNAWNAQCPLTKVRPGMLLDEVKRAAGRKAKFDKDTWAPDGQYGFFVDAGSCHADIRFSDLDKRVEVIDPDEGLGDNKPIVREHPELAKAFANAYVIANRGLDPDLTDEELEQRGMDEYRIWTAFDPRHEHPEYLSAAAMRTMKLILQKPPRIPMPEQQPDQSLFPAAGKPLVH